MHDGLVLRDSILINKPQSSRTVGSSVEHQHAFSNHSTSNLPLLANDSTVDANSAERFSPEVEIEFAKDFPQADAINHFLHRCPSTRQARFP